MQNQINTTPIAQFSQLLKAAELSQQKEVKIPIQQARLLSLALNEILVKLNQDYETLFNALQQGTGQEVVTVSMDGGVFGNEK
jgi:hypothetical protein